MITIMLSISGAGGNSTARLLAFLVNWNMNKKKQRKRKGSKNKQKAALLGCV
jgi:hypothetical protein